MPFYRLMDEVVDIAEVEAETSITVTSVANVPTTTNLEAVRRAAEGVPLNLVKTTRHPVDQEAAEAEMAAVKAEVETTSTLPLIWPILPISVTWVTNRRKFGKVV